MIVDLIIELFILLDINILSIYLSIKSSSASRVDVPARKLMKELINSINLILLDRLID